jgi:hypothetical protein
MTPRGTSSAASGSDLLRTQLQETGRCPVGGMNLQGVLFILSDLGLNEWEVLITHDGCIEVIDRGE